MLFAVLFLEGVSDAVAALANWVPVAATLQGVHDWVFVLGVTLRTEHLCGVLVWVMATAVAAAPWCLFRHYFFLRIATRLR